VIALVDPSGASLVDCFPGRDQPGRRLGNIEVVGERCLDEFGQNRVVQSLPIFSLVIRRFSGRIGRPIPGKVNFGT